MILVSSHISSPDIGKNGCQSKNILIRILTIGELEKKRLAFPDLAPSVGAALKLPVTC
jgi:hypothetical protein